MPRETGTLFNIARPPSLQA